MITGVSSIKKEIVPHGENYYLIGATVVHRDDGDKFFVSVLQNSCVKLESLKCGGLDELLVLYDNTIVRYKAIAGA